MSRPQENEIRSALEVFFADEPDPDLKVELRKLVIHAPDSKKGLDFYYQRQWPENDEDFEAYIAEEQRRISAERDAKIAAGLPVGPDQVPEAQQVAFIHFQWPGTDKKMQAFAKQLGVDPPELITHEANPFTKEPVLHPVTKEPVVVRYHSDCERQVSGPDDALALCLFVLREIKEVPDDAWLWITDDDDDRNWPDPLPKPKVWPTTH
jgi:hypothetical protein